MYKSSTSKQMNKNCLSDTCHNTSDGCKKLWLDVMPLLFTIQGSRKAQGVGANNGLATRIRSAWLGLIWLEGIELHVQGVRKSEATPIPVPNDKSDDHSPLLFKPLQVFACGHPRLAQIIPSHPGSHALKKHSNSFQFLASLSPMSWHEYIRLVSGSFEIEAV